MRLKFLVVSLIVAISSFGADSQLLSELRSLNSQQKYVLNEAYMKGAEFNYGYTLAAIAWKESDFGRYVINVKDGEYGSYGVFHNLLSSVCARHKCTDWKKSRLAERLIFDFDFSFSEALSELKYWENYWKSKGVQNMWQRTVASYNAGYNWKNGIAYKRDIARRIRALRTYFKKEKQ